MSADAQHPYTTLLTSSTVASTFPLIFPSAPMALISLLPRPRGAQGHLALPNLQAQGTEHLRDPDDEPECETIGSVDDETPVLRRSTSQPTLTPPGHRDAVDPEDDSILIPTPRTPLSAPISRAQTAFNLDEHHPVVLDSPGHTGYLPKQSPRSPEPRTMIPVPLELYQQTAQQYLLSPSLPTPGTPRLEPSFNPIEREIMDEITSYILAFRSYTPAPDIKVITNYDGPFANAMVVRQVSVHDPPTMSPPENFVLHTGPPAASREGALRGLLSALERTAERPGRLGALYRVRPASIVGTEEVERKGPVRGLSFAEMRAQAEEMDRAQRITRRKLRNA